MTNTYDAQRDGAFRGWLYEQTDALLIQDITDYREENGGAAGELDDEDYEGSVGGYVLSVRETDTPDLFLVMIDCYALAAEDRLPEKTDYFLTQMQGGYMMVPTSYHGDEYSVCVYLIRQPAPPAAPTTVVG